MNLYDKVKFSKVSLVFITLLSSIILSSCSTTANNIPTKIAMSDGYITKGFNNYVNGQLTGADNDFIRAIEILQSNDNSCRIAEAYTLYYLLTEMQVTMHINNAIKYAKFGGCNNILSYAYSLTNNTKVVDSKEELSIIVGTILNAKMNPNGLRAEEQISRLNSNNVHQIYQSAILRIEAQIEIENKRYEEAEKLTQYAYNIDYFNGWTLYLRNDLAILLITSKNLNPDATDYQDNLDKRIDILKDYIK